jgi:hypothetical protein
MPAMRADEVAQVVEHLSSKCEALSSNTCLIQNKKIKCSLNCYKRGNAQRQKGTMSIQVKARGRSTHH